MRHENRSESNRKLAVSIDDGDHMDVLMINALLHSLFTIFTTMVRLKIEPGIPIAKENQTAKGAVSGLIGMKADGASGSVALSLTLPAVREISQGLLGSEITSIDKEAVDLVRELTNMLAGGAKRILSEKGYDFDMQIPLLLQGDSHEIKHHYSGQTVLFPIRLRQSEFYLELNFV